MFGGGGFAQSPGLCYGHMFRPPGERLWGERQRWSCGPSVIISRHPFGPCMVQPGVRRSEEGSEPSEPAVPTRASPEQRSRCCQTESDFVLVFLGSPGAFTLLHTFLAGRDPVLIKQRGSFGSLVAQQLNAGNKTFLSF